MVSTSATHVAHLSLIECNDASSSSAMLWTLLTSLAASGALPYVAPHLAIIQSCLEAAHWNATNSDRPSRPYWHVLNDRNGDSSSSEL